MYNELITLLGISPQEDLFGFLLCIMILIFMIDKIFVFIYSIFQR